MDGVFHSALPSVLGDHTTRPRSQSSTRNLKPRLNIQFTMQNTNQIPESKRCEPVKLYKNHLLLIYIKYCNAYASKWFKI